jgi:TPR repeat protein
MANTLSNPKPGARVHPALVYLAAGMIALTGAGLVRSRLHADTPPPATSLRQAVATFDAGDLTGGASAFARLATSPDPHVAAQAAYWYGHALDRGLGTVQDSKAAIAEYRKAWAGGVAPAATRLGEMYLEGNAMAPQFATARTYLTDAANRGDARAALDLGHMLRDGIGAPADPVGAYAWIEVAALRGNSEARVERDHMLASLAPAQQEAAAKQAAALQSAQAAPPPAKPPTPTQKPASATS